MKYGTQIIRLGLFYPRTGGMFRIPTGFSTLYSARHNYANTLFFKIFRKTTDGTTFSESIIMTRSKINKSL